MSNEDNRVAWPIVEALDAAAVRLKRENAELRGALDAANNLALHDRDTIAALRLGIDARVRTLTQERDDAAEIATRLRDELNDARAMLREIRRTVIASVRGEEHAVMLTDEEVDAHAASTPVDVGNLVARMQSAEAQVAYLAAERRRDVDAFREALDSVQNERAELHAIIAGRTTPPTDAEIAVHHAAGGEWLGFREDVRTWCHGPEVVSFTYSEEHERSARRCSRFWPLDVEGRPCAWPVVEAKRCE